MTDSEFDELHGGRDLLPIEQEIYEQEGAERFARHHGKLLRNLAALAQPQELNQ